MHIAARFQRHVRTEEIQPRRLGTRIALAPAITPINMNMPLNGTLTALRWFNEMYDDGGLPREHYGAYAEWLGSKPVEFMLQKQKEADTLYARQGITFAVYGDEGGVERSIPFDIIPRIMRPGAWKVLSDGCIQRVRALNAFLKDIYHGQEIIKSGIIPEQQILGNNLFRPEM